MNIAHRMQHKGFVTLMIALVAPVGVMLLASSALTISDGDLWSSAGLPIGYFLLVSSLHAYERVVRRPARLRFTRDSTGVRIPVNRTQLRLIFAISIGLTLPGVWGICIAIATGSTWWPWLIPTMLFAPMSAIAARSMARRPMLVLNPHTIEFIGPSSDTAAAWDDVDIILAVGQPPLEQLAIIVRPGAPSWRTRTFRLTAKMAVTNSCLLEICMGELWAGDREMVTVLCPVLDLYRREPGLRSELLSEAFEHRINSQRLINGEYQRTR